MLVAYCRLCCHCRNSAKGGCLLSRFPFRCCRYFLGHVTCRNLPWQGLIRGIELFLEKCGSQKFRPDLEILEAFTMGLVDSFLGDFVSQRLKFF